MRFIRLTVCILVAALAFAGSARLSAQDNGSGNPPVRFIPEGETVYDIVNHVTWLVEGNLAKTLPDGTNVLFGLTVCKTPTTEPTNACANADGSMSYTSALAWILGMNAASYQGHQTWQLPTAPLKDHGCTGVGPAPFREGFAFDCDAGALGYLYYTAFGLKAPNTAVPIPPNTVGPFINFQPNLYWSGSPGGGLTCTIGNFSFGSGAQSGGCGGDYADVLPMIQGKAPGIMSATGKGLEVNSDGTLVYDPETHDTWLADADLAASNRFGLAPCKTPTKPQPCVAANGAMNYYSATQYILAMNEFDGGTGYLHHTDWVLPPIDAGCPTYGCGGDSNPMGNLYYSQLKLVAGKPVVTVPDIAIGPFEDLQPFPYWSCLADTIQDDCEPAKLSTEPSRNSEWGFSFATGFLGTARETANHYVTAYFVGCDLSSCQTISFSPIPAAGYALSSLTLSATASSGLAVSLASITPKVCTVSGNTASLRIPGKCTIEASQAGNDSFLSALPVEQTMTVDHAQQQITFPPIPTQKKGIILDLTATASSGLNVSFVSLTPKVCSILGASVTTLTTGICTIEAFQSGNNIFAPAPEVTRYFTVKER
jgi:hypothetical protein